MADLCHAGKMRFGAFQHGTVHRWGPRTAASCWKSIRTGQTSGEWTLSEGSGASPSLEDSVCTQKWKVCSSFCYDRSRIPHFQIQKLSYCGVFFKARPSHNRTEMQPEQATIPSIPYRIIISYQTPWWGSGGLWFSSAAMAINKRFTGCSGWSGRNVGGLLTLLEPTEISHFLWSVKKRLRARAKLRQE